MSNEPLRTVSNEHAEDKKREGDGAATPTPRTKQSRRIRKNPDDKIPIAELYRAVTNAINRSSLSILPAFKEIFNTQAVESGAAIVLEEDASGLCRKIDRERVAQAVLRYVTDRVPDDGYKWTSRQARDCADTWQMYTYAREAPAAILWADEPGRCFHRLPWPKSAPAAATPLCDEIMSRMSNALAFQVWLGSLFDPRADLQQYVWLHGEGENGKGTLVRMLERVFGGSFTAQEPPGKESRFWTSGLIGKRLAVFPDCNAAGFVTSGLFKSLTGGDAVRIEGKGEPSSTARLAVKFFFLSNEKPRLSSEHADMRRVIFCDLGPIIGGSQTGYEDQLWLEFGDFLRRCVCLYAEHCPGGGKISCVDRSGIDAVVSVEEEPFEAAFCANFEHVGLVEGLWEHEQAHANPVEFQAVLHAYFADKRDHQKFRKWLFRVHGIEKKRVKKPDNTLENRYLGISMRPRSTK